MHISECIENQNDHFWIVQKTAEQVPMSHLVRMYVVINDPGQSQQNNCLCAVKIAKYQYVVTLKLKSIYGTKCGKNFQIRCSMLHNCGSIMYIDRAAF